MVYKKRMLCLAVFAMFLLATLVSGGCGMLKTEDNPEHPNNNGNQEAPDINSDTIVSGSFIDYSETFLDLYKWSDLVVTGTFGPRKGYSSVVDTYKFYVDSVLYGSYDAEDLTIYQLKDPIAKNYDVFRTFLLFLNWEHYEEQDRFFIVGGGYQGAFFDSHGELGGLCPIMIKSARSELGIDTFDDLEDYVLHNSPNR